jgi:hypothetical protein
MGKKAAPADQRKQRKERRSKSRTWTRISGSFEERSRTTRKKRNDLYEDEG